MCYYKHSEINFFRVSGAVGLELKNKRRTANLLSSNLTGPVFCKYSVAKNCCLILCLLRFYWLSCQIVDMFVLFSQKKNIVVAFSILIYFRCFAKLASHFFLVLSLKTLFCLNYFSLYFISLVILYSVV